MTAIDPISIIPKYVTNKNEPTEYSMNFEAIIKPVAKRYRLDIDCNNDSDYEKYLTIESNNEKGTSYAVNEVDGELDISREINTVLRIPFSCNYPLYNYIQPTISWSMLLSNMDFDLTLPRSIKVNMFTRAYSAYQKDNNPISYHTSIELSEKHIRYFRNPTKYPIRP